MKKEIKLILIEELKKINKLYQEKKISFLEAEDQIFDFYKKINKDNYFMNNNTTEIMKMINTYLPPLYKKGIIENDDKLSLDYDLESFKDNDYKKEIIDFFSEKRKDPNYPKNLIIEHRSKIGARSLCNSIFNKLNLSYNSFLMGFISEFNFRRRYYNENANVNVFFHEAKDLIKNDFLEKILGRKEFIIKPRYEKMRIINIKDQLNLFLCDLVPFLYGIKNIEIINYVNEKCKFIKIDYEKIGGKLYK